MSISVYKTGVKPAQHSDLDNLNKTSHTGAKAHFDSIMSVMETDYDLQRNLNDTTARISPEDAELDAPTAIEKPKTKQDIDQGDSRKNIEAKESTIVKEDHSTSSKSVELNDKSVAPEQKSSDNNLANIVYEQGKKSTVEATVKKNEGVIEQSLDEFLSVNPIETPIVDENLQVEGVLEPTEDLLVVEFAEPVILDVDTSQDAIEVAVETISQLVIPLPEEPENTVDLDTKEQQVVLNPVVDNIQFNPKTTTTPMVETQQPVEKAVLTPDLALKAAQVNNESPVVQSVELEPLAEEVLDQLKAKEIRTGNEPTLQNMKKNLDAIIEAELSEDIDVDDQLMKQTHMVSNRSVSSAIAGRSDQALPINVKTAAVTALAESVGQLDSKQSETLRFFRQEIQRTTFAEKLADAKMKAQTFEPPFNMKILRRLELKLRDPAGTIELDIAQEEAAIHIKVIAPVEAIEDMKVVGNELDQSLAEHGLFLGSYETSSGSSEGVDDSDGAATEQEEELNPVQTGPEGTGTLINRMV